MDEVHIYDDVGHQGGGYRSSNKTEAVTSFTDRQKYMTLSGQQGGQSEYQEPQLCSKNTREAVDTRNDEFEVKGSPDCCEQRNELTQMKRCLCVLSFLVVILFLIAVSSLGLAAYGFKGIGSPRSQTQEASSEGIADSTTLDNHNFTLFMEQLTQEAIQIWENISSLRNTVNQEIHQLRSLTATSEARINEQLVALRNVANTIESRINATSRDIAGLALRSTVSSLESRLTAINSEVVSQRTFTNSLESRLNGINSQVSTLTPLRSSVTSLQSQLRTTDMTVSSLQLVIRSQPSMQYM
jgi:hypothetical protein